jgi:hypothetical protein
MKREEKGWPIYRNKGIKAKVTLGNKEEGWKKIGNNFAH